MEPVVRVTTHLGRPLTYLRLVFLLLGAALAVALVDPRRAPSSSSPPST